LEATGLSIGEALDECAWPDVGHNREPDGLVALDQRLAALCREQGALRAIMATLAFWFVRRETWDELGYARLSDYALERLGLSARWVYDLGHVGVAFGTFPQLEHALASGTLGWTKVRLLASLPRGEDADKWIALARRLTADQLARTVRRFDHGSIEAGALEKVPRNKVFEVRCTEDVRLKWWASKHYASRVAGRIVSRAEAAEMIVAEALSAIPVDDPAEPEPARDDLEVGGDAPADEPDLVGLEKVAPPAAFNGYGPLQELLDGLRDADAFELDARLRRALALERRLDARMGPLLLRVWGRRLHRMLGYRTREAYARERLGMDPTRARALVRLERAAMQSGPFARAYRSAELSGVKAGLLVPLVSVDPLGRFTEEWVAWAKQVTVRRLREDVDWALTLEDTDPAEFRRTGGLPDDREIGAKHRNPARDTPTPSAREILAKHRAAETCTVTYIGPADVIQLLRAVICTVRRRMEAVDGRSPTAGQALGAVLDHAFATWGVGQKVPADHNVFARDGWLCKVPGCSSMQNLHRHHVIFSSKGGSDDDHNRVTLCAFHHLRGIHAERIRCTGRAPDGLTWQIGIRPGRAPLVTYASGDREVTEPRP
jgi:hypothetical protein